MFSFLFHSHLSCFIIDLSRCQRKQAGNYYIKYFRLFPHKLYYVFQHCLSVFQMLNHSTLASNKIIKHETTSLNHSGF